jgi:hypothetical protein
VEKINLNYIQTWILLKQSQPLELSTSERKVQEDVDTWTKYTLMTSNCSDGLLYHLGPKMRGWGVSGEFGVEGREMELRACVRARVEEGTSGGHHSETCVSDSVSILASPRSSSSPQPPAALDTLTFVKNWTFVQEWLTSGSSQRNRGDS